MVLCNTLVVFSTMYTWTGWSKSTNCVAKWYCCYTVVIVVIHLEVKIIREGAKTKQRVGSVPDWIPAAEWVPYGSNSHPIQFLLAYFEIIQASKGETLPIREWPWGSLLDLFQDRDCSQYLDLQSIILVSTQLLVYTTCIHIYKSN